MGLILWIDKNSFSASLIAKVFKSRGLEFYHLSDARDFAYLVEDLKPALIVIDAQTATDDLAALERQYQENSAVQNSSYVVIGEWEKLGFIQKKVGQLPRVLEPFEVPDALNRFLGL